MKFSQENTLPRELAIQLTELGEKLSRLRIARRVTQQVAAKRAGISRTTASLIENGSPSIAVGQIIRYIYVIARGKTLASLLNEKDPSIYGLESRERRQRATPLSQKELKELDF